jgi:RimJ/RimL family protein N-acetyltransferase
VSSPFSASTIITDRLMLTPLRTADAAAMAGVLGDERLHEFIGGAPATAPELRARYERLAAGSGRAGEHWLNWIVRLRPGGEPIGTVQATVLVRPPGTAHVAWVVGVPWQGRGFATEAARALVGWLRDQGVSEIVAHVHPDHVASARVAASAGLAATGESADGEQVWRLAEPTG